MVRRLLSLAAAAALIAAAGCTKPVDLKQAVQLVDITAGWHDAGIVEGKNKLVPSVTFRVRKSVEQDISPLQLNVVFKRLGGPAEEDWDEVFVPSVHFEGNETTPLTVRSKTGYTGDPPQSRADMLRHSAFRDMRVHVFAKHASAQWVEIATIDIPRQLLAQ